MKGFTDIQKMGIILPSGQHIFAFPNEKKEELLLRVGGSLIELINKNYIFYQTFWYTNEVQLHLLSTSIPLARRYFNNNNMAVFLYAPFRGVQKLIKSTQGWSGLRFDDEVIVEGTLIAAYSQEFGLIDGETVHVGHAGSDHVVLANDLEYGSLEDALKNGLVKYVKSGVEIQLELVPFKASKTAAIEFLKKEKPTSVVIDWVTRKGDIIWSEKSPTLADAIVHIMRFGDA